MAVVGFTNLNGGGANKAYYEAEVAEAAQEQARTRLAAYYATPMAARWVSLSGRLAADGAEIAPGEISRAFDGYAPLAFTATDRQGRLVETGAVADRLDAPNRRAGDGHDGVAAQELLCPGADGGAGWGGGAGA